MAEAASQDTVYEAWSIETASGHWDIYFMSWYMRLISWHPTVAPWGWRDAIYWDQKIWYIWNRVPMVLELAHW